MGVGKGGRGALLPLGYLFTFTSKFSKDRGREAPSPTPISRF